MMSGNPDGGRRHESGVSGVMMNFVASQQKNIISLHFLPQNLEVTENIPIFAPSEMTNPVFSAWG